MPPLASSVLTPSGFSPRTWARRSISRWKPAIRAIRASIRSATPPPVSSAGDCADFTYQQAWIDGDSIYRTIGTRGTARFFFNVTVQGARPVGPHVLHEPFGDVPEANVFGHQLHIEPDGTFELYVGGPERGPNWLPTTPASRKLFIRQGFDRWDERPGHLRIERIDMAAPKPVPTAATMIEAMEWQVTSSPA